MHPVRIEYPITHSLAHQQREQTPFGQELQLDRQVVSGILSSTDWLRFERLPWSFENGTAVLRSDNITARHTLSGHAAVTINAIARVEVVFTTDVPLHTWVATSIHTNAVEVLNDINALVSHDFTPARQLAIGAQIGDVLTRLYAEWDLPGLEEKLTEYSFKISAIAKDFHSQWRDMYWTVCAPGADPLPSGGYSWSGESPLPTEALRFLYYITQSFSFIDHSKGTLWIKPAALSQGLDLSFLHLRLFSSGNAHRPSVVAVVKNKPVSELAPQTTTFMEALALFSQDEIADETRQLIWHSAALIEFLPATAAVLALEWSATEMRGIICDTKYRAQLTGRVPLEDLVEGSLLERTLLFWAKHSAVNLGPDGSHTRAWRLVREYFSWIEAKKLGLSLPTVSVFREEDVVRLRKSLVGSENMKKMEPLLSLIADVGPTKYSALAPAADVLDCLLPRFPNFKNVILMLQKQLRLAKRQSNPMFHLHPVLIVGDPGWGKTRFLNALSAALGLPYTEVSMASLTAGFVLGGGDMMWAGSKHGKIADLFLRGSCINPMVVLDELDKGGKDPRHDSYGPLYSLLERHTAARFVDETLTVPLDAQHICWFGTANSVDAIPSPILDRFEVFEICALTPDESGMVAQSIYTELLSSHSWGSAFTVDLDPALARGLHGKNARQMYRTLRDACANAAARDDVQLSLISSDINIGSKRRSIGF